jgi:hypothetical protein
MWTYFQSTGHFLDPTKKVLGIGYSGLDADKNVDADQGVKGMGPIPQGDWSIGVPEDDERLGPVAMELLPLDGTDALGRSGFFIHGDSVDHPGSASHGCVILPRSIRVQIALSEDRVLRVEA